MHTILKKGWLGCLCLLGTLAQAQPSHRVSISLPVVKDGLNNGLLFQGVGLAYTFAVQKKNNKRLMRYEGRLGLVGVQREGLLGVGLRVQPIRYFSGFQVSNAGKTTITVGPAAWLEYQLFLYPDLQMGHPLWMSNLSLAPQLMVEQRLANDSQLVVRLAGSVVSATSRPDGIDAYFFSLRPGDLLRDLHSNVQVGSLKHINQTDLSVDYRVSRRQRGWSVGYELSYSHYAEQPSFQSLMHGLSLTFYR